MPNEITLPYEFTPRDYQLPLLKAWDSGVKRMVCVWNRRTGKDKTAIAMLPKKMYERVGGYFYFAPTYSQGKRIIWDGIDSQGMKMLDHIPTPIISRRHETELKIDLTNGSYFQIIGTDNIDAVVGTNPIGCIFTEYSLQNKLAWEYMRPVLAANGGWAVFLYTPRGMNHGYELLQQAKNTPGWYWEVLTLNETHVLTPEALEEERKQMPEALFQQEYYCKFLEGANAFFKLENVKRWNGALLPEEGHTYSLGVDLAKINDYTVLTPVDLSTFRVGKQERFNQIDYNLQKARIEAYYYRYTKPKTTVDSTGVGEPIYDDLVARGIGNLEPYHFTEASRMALLNNLRILLEQGKLTLPDDPILIAELQSMQYEVSDRGKIRVACPEKLHDDCVMSLALAVWGMPQAPVPVKQTHHTPRPYVAESKYEGTMGYPQPTDDITEAELAKM